MNKTIFLVLADTPNGRKNYLPYSLLYLGNSLKKANYQVEVRHIIEKDFDKVADEIINKKPLLVGFSVITGLHIVYAARISKKIKKENKEIPICWGGVHPSLLGDQCLEENYIDFVINGDGEETIVELSHQLTGERKFSEVKGLGYKENNKIHSAERRFVTDLSTVRADFSLVDIESYLTYFPEGQSRVLTYITSRGCPHRCTFCYNLNYNKQRWRQHSLDVIKADIDLLKENYRIDGIKFVDDNFFVNKNRALEILRYLDLPSTFDMRIDYLVKPNIIDEELLKELKSLKVLEFLVGFESGSERTQKLVRKDCSMQQCKNFIDLLARQHFRCHYSFIIALPGEKYEDIKLTIDTILYIIKNHKEGTFTPGQYLPYPGTPLYHTAIEMGFKVPQTTEGWGILDRWDNKMELPWSPVDSNFCYFIKWYSFFIAARVSVVTSICRWRLKTLNFKFPLELKLFLFLYNTAYHSNYKLSKIIKPLAKMFQFKLNSTLINADK